MIVDKLTAILEWEVDAAALDDFNKQTGSIVNWGKKIAGAAAFAASALTALGGITLKETTNNLRLAESVGLSADGYLAWEGVLKHVGFEGEKVVDLVEEMTNKIGEMKGLGEMTAVSESLQQLNIDFKALKDTAPEEQFMMILEAAKAIDDDQIAASAVDMIMGGEANRILGLLRQYDGSVEDILSTHRQLNMITDRGIAGAMAWSVAWDNMTTSASSLFTELAGRAGSVIAPYINKVLDWVAANRQLIDQKIEAVVGGIASSMRWLAWAGERVAGVIGALGGFGNALKLAATAVVAWKAAGLVAATSRAIAAFMAAAKGVKKLKAAIKLLGKTPLVALLIAAALALEDLYVFLTGGKSFFGEWTKNIGDAVDKGILRFTGAIRDLTDAEKEAYREANRLADSVDIQKEFEDIETAKFRQKMLDVFSVVEDNAKSVANTIKSTFSSAVDSVVAQHVKGFNAVADALYVVHDTTIAIANKIVDAVSGAVDSVVAQNVKGFNTIADALYVVYDTAIAIANKIVDAVSSAVSSAISGFMSFASAAWDWISGFGSSVVDAVLGAFKTVLGALKELPVIGDLFKGVDIGAQITTMSQTIVNPIAAGIPMQAQAPTRTVGAATNTTHVENNTPVNVAPTVNVIMNETGASPQSVATEVSKQIGEQVHDAVQRTSSGVRR